jgi:hypothetical protein
VLGAQPVLDAGDAQDENLGARRGIGVIGNLQDKPRAGPVRPRTFLHLVSYTALALPPLPDGCCGAAMGQ